MSDLPSRPNFDLETLSSIRRRSGAAKMSSHPPGFSSRVAFPQFESDTELGEVHPLLAEISADASMVRDEDLPPRPNLHPPSPSRPTPAPPVREWNDFRASHYVPINLPKFWENDIALWFTTIENIFRLKGVYGEVQRYELLLTALDLRHLQKLEYSMTNLDKHRPYTQIREEILNIFAPSPDRRLNELLYETQLGDRKPSELLFLMRKLLGTNESPHLLKKLFLERLPPDTQKIIVSGPDCDLNELAQRADRVMAQERSTSAASNPFAAGTSNRSLMSENTLQNQIDALSSSINQILSTTPVATNASKAELMHSNPFAQNSNFNAPQRRANWSYADWAYSSTPNRPVRGSSRGRGSYRGSPYPRHVQNRYSFSNDSNASNSDLCFYHSRFGTRAHKCMPGCTWQGTALAETTPKTRGVPKNF